MNMQAVEKIANAVLYEGYMLYPYRASSIKNQQRFNFGVLYPRNFGDTWEMTTECLATGGAIEVKTRFLQMADEREICIPPCELGSFPYRQEFSFAGLDGEVELSSIQLEDGLFKITLNIRNLTDSAETNREKVLFQSLASVHSILALEGGEFISLLDPLPKYRHFAPECRNIGTWPVMVGDEDQRNMMLSAPIILYDYPEIAPESPGDLCDGTEIDEILALRILTMTESEKQEIRNGDDRARQILERTEMLPAEHFQKLHGALRSLK